MIAIVDYGMGNLQSISNAFELIGTEVVVTSDPLKLALADAIVVPGVGAFSDGMKNLREGGFLDVLQREVIEKKKPFLGICLGMQFLATKSYEHGEFEGLSWVDAEVRLIEPESNEYKIPHMGWNDCDIKDKDVLFKSFNDKETFYFVHSYAMQTAEADDLGKDFVITSSCFHGKHIVASLRKDNIFGAQFHPEKSQGAGIQLLRNFVAYVESQKQ